MSAYNKDKALKWLNEKWLNSRNCPICGNNTWGLSEDLGGLFLMRNNNINLGPSIPVLPVHCNNCGYMILFSAVLAGLINEGAKNDSSE